MGRQSARFPRIRQVAVRRCLFPRRALRKRTHGVSNDSSRRWRQPHAGPAVAPHHPAQLLAEHRDPRLPARHRPEPSRGRPAPGHASQRSHALRFLRCCLCPCLSIAHRVNIETCAVSRFFEAAHSSEPGSGSRILVTVVMGGAGGRTHKQANKRTFGSWSLVICKKPLDQPSQGPWDVGSMECMEPTDAEPWRGNAQGCMFRKGRHTT